MNTTDTLEQIKDIANHFSEVEAKYPIAVEEFRRLQQLQYSTFINKLNDYGPYNVTLGREVNSDDGKHLAMTVIAIRCSEKVQRLINLLYKKDSKPKNEPLIDSFDDISIYGLVAQIINNGKWGK